MDTGRADDLKSAKKVAEEAVRGGLVQDALGQMDEQGEVSVLLKEGEVRARDLLRNRWPAVRTVAARLMSEGTLDQQGFESAVRAAGVRVQAAGKTEVKPFVKRDTVKCVKDDIFALFHY
jgi:hypothetical protein